MYTCCYTETCLLPMTMTMTMTMTMRVDLYRCEVGYSTFECQTSRHNTNSSTFSFVHGPMGKMPRLTRSISTILSWMRIPIGPNRETLGRRHLLPYSSWCHLYYTDWDIFLSWLKPCTIYPNWETCSSRVVEHGMTNHIQLSFRTKSGKTLLLNELHESFHYL